MAILATEKVLTLDYWKPAHKLQVGDYVFDRKGKPVRIKLVQEYRAQSCYEITFRDLLSIRGDNHLTFAAEDIKYRKRISSYKGKLKFRRPLVKVTAQTLANSPLKSPQDSRIYSVPTTDPIQLPHQDLPVPPFVFGFWFFNQNAKKLMHTWDDYYEEVAQRFKDYGYIPKVSRGPSPKSTYFKVTPNIEHQLAPLIPTQIPNNYLMGSVEQRVELLSGIMNGIPQCYKEKTDTFTFSNPFKGMCSRVQHLAESLGSRTSLVFCNKDKIFRLTFKTHFKLLDRQQPKPLKVHPNRRVIIDVKEIPAQSCVHIETDGEDGTFLVGEGYIACL